MKSRLITEIQDLNKLVINLEERIEERKKEEVEIADLEKQLSAAKVKLDNNIDEIFTQAKLIKEIQDLHERIAILGKEIKDNQTKKQEFLESFKNLSDKKFPTKNYSIENIIAVLETMGSGDFHRNYVPVINSIAQKPRSSCNTQLLQDQGKVINRLKETGERYIQLNEMITDLEKQLKEEKLELANKIPQCKFFVMPINEPNNKNKKDNGKDNEKRNVL